MLNNNFKLKIVVSRSKLRFYSNPSDGTYDLPIPEKAKALMRSRISGALTSISWVSLEKDPMFTSILPYALHDRWYGNPLFVLNKESQHYKNVVENQKGSFVVLPLTPKHINPSKVPLPRVNLIGNVKLVDKEDDIQIVLDSFEKIIPGSCKLFESISTAVYEFVVDSAHYQTSSGSMESITADQFRTSKEDAISKFSRPLMEKANANSTDKLQKLCLKYANMETSECFIFGLDEKGMDVLAKGLVTPDIIEIGKENNESNSFERWTQLRFPWDEHITDLKQYSISLDQFLNEKSK